MNNTLLSKEELSLYDYVKLRNLILIIFALFKYLKLKDANVSLPKITTDFRVRYDDSIKVDSLSITDINLKNLLLKVKDESQKRELLSKITLALRKLNELELQVFNLIFYKCKSEQEIIDTVNYGKDKVREIRKSACIKFISALGLDYMCFK